MLPPRILGLLVILLAVQGLCKPTKSTEDSDYEDDTPFDEDDEEDEEEDDNVGGAEAPPQILSQGISIRVKAGSTVILPCQVIHTENFVVTWMKDNKMLYFETQPHVEDSKRIVRLPNNSLAIYNASVSDSSNNYKCSILRQPDSINLTHRLLVDPERIREHSSPPQHSHKGIIRVIPSRRVEVNQGNLIRLGCETDTQPPPEIKWFIETKKVDGYDPDVILDGNYIIIKKVNRSHSGLYQCLAEDGSKTPAMEAINVIVHYIPEIEVKKRIVHSGEGIESEMTCIVSAYPEALITWHKDGKEIVQKKGRVEMHHGFIMKGNKTKHVLKILHTSKENFGEYECRAENTIGKDIKSIMLTGTPSQPRLFGAEMTKNDAGLLLKWRLESYSPIKEYRLQYRRKGNEKWTVVQPEVKDSEGNQFKVEYPIENLQPGSYEAILSARNSFGWSMQSEPHMFTGDYPSEMAQKDGNSAAIQTPGILLALILVVLSCAFTSV